MPFILNQIHELDPASARTAYDAAAEFGRDFTERSGTDNRVLRTVGCCTTGTLMLSVGLPSLDAIETVERALSDGAPLVKGASAPARQELFEIVHGEGEDDALPPSRYYLALRSYSCIGREQEAVGLAVRMHDLSQRYTGRPGLVAVNYNGRWAETLAISGHVSLASYESARRAWMADPEAADVIASAAGVVASGEVLLYQRLH